jgi:hypothetical protein
MAVKPVTNATKKQNSGSRPVCTTCSENHPDTSNPYPHQAVCRPRDLPGGI